MYYYITVISSLCLTLCMPLIHICSPLSFLSSDFPLVSLVSIANAQDRTTKEFEKPTYFTHASIQELISSHTKIQHVESFELGSINWTQRTMHTLGIGTHRILSPTGGWTQQDLHKVAHQNAHAKLQRLAQTALSLSAQHTCPLETLSRIYQTQHQQTFSDGSVHLPAHITFDAYHPCFYDYLRYDTSKEKWTQNSNSKTSYANQIRENSHQHAHKVYSEIHQQKRAVIWLYINDQKLSNTLVKTIALNIRNQHYTKHSIKFLTIRWFKLPKAGSEKSNLQKKLQKYQPYLFLWAKDEITSPLIVKELTVDHFMPHTKWKELIQSKAPTLSQLHSWQDDIQELSHAQLQELLLYAPQSELWIWSRY